MQRYTEKNFSLNTTDIDRVRVTCNYCQTAVVFPIEADFFVVECISCHQKMDTYNIKSMIEAIKKLKQKDRKSGVTFDFLVHLEGELP